METFEMFHRLHCYCTPCPVMLDAVTGLACCVFYSTCATNDVLFILS